MIEHLLDQFPRPIPASVRADMNATISGSHLQSRAFALDDVGGIVANRRQTALVDNFHAADFKRICLNAPRPNFNSYHKHTNYLLA